jgi:chromosome partitioning protein
MELACFESEILEAGEHQKLDLGVQSLLQSARTTYDVVLIDCPPGVTALTMLWLEHCDAFLPPTTPNYLGVRGLAVTSRLRERFAKQRRRFAPSIGTLITLDSDTPSEQLRKQEIRARDHSSGISPFSRQIPRLVSIQRSAEYDLSMRSFAAKYPRTTKHDLPRIIKELAREVAQRVN